MPTRGERRRFNPDALIRVVDNALGGARCNEGGVINSLLEQGRLGDPCLAGLRATKAIGDDGKLIRGLAGLLMRSAGGTGVLGAINLTLANLAKDLRIQDRSDPFGDCFIGDDPDEFLSS